MPVVDYASSDLTPRVNWRRHLTVVAVCVSIGLGLVLSFPALDTAQWLERAHFYNLDKPLIAQVEQGQRGNIIFAVIAWSVLGTAWATYLGYRSYKKSR